MLNVVFSHHHHQIPQFNLQCWALTAEAFLDDEEWKWLYDHFGYTGDYEVIYFE